MPRQGLQDTWATLRCEFLDDRFVCYTEYHGYRSDFGGLDFGRELNVSGEYKIRNNLPRY